jgi:hypothetical protein
MAPWFAGFVGGTLQVMQQDAITHQIYVGAVTPALLAVLQKGAFQSVPSGARLCEIVLF